MRTHPTNPSASSGVKLFLLATLLGLTAATLVWIGGWLDGRELGWEGGGVGPEGVGDVGGLLAGLRWAVLG